MLSISVFSILACVNGESVIESLFLLFQVLSTYGYERNPRGGYRPVIMSLGMVFSDHWYKHFKLQYFKIKESESHEPDKSVWSSRVLAIVLAELSLRIRLSRQGTFWTFLNSNALFDQSAWAGPGTEQTIPRPCLFFINF